MLNSKEYDADIPHGLLIRVQAVYGSLKQAERKAADLLLQDPCYFASATIVEASERAVCSEATFTRFARRLGFQGYPELRKALLDEQEPLPYATIGKDDTCRDVVTKVFEASAQALRDTLQALETDCYEAAVRALCRAEKLLFCGSGGPKTGGE